jgi:polyisoprenoid-binding protein YceI
MEKKAHLWLVVFLFAAGTGKCQFKPVDDQSLINFRIRNFGISVNGLFKGIKGEIRFDPTKPEEALFDVSIDATTVNTDNSMRDDHLRGTNYFDTQHYPTIRFISTKLVPSNKQGFWMLSGRLTIKDHVKDIYFPFSATAVKGGYLFKGAFMLKRKEFNVGGSSTISDELEVSLDVFAK